MEDTKIFLNKYKKHNIIDTNISFNQLVLLNTLQLVTGVTGLFSQGATAVIHGCLVHALGHNLGDN